MSHDVGDPRGAPPSSAPHLPPADDSLARDLRGFGPIGILAILVILAGNLVVVPLSAVLVLLWARRARVPYRHLGFVRSRSWALTIVVGVVFGAAFKLLMKAIVMPLLGAEPINQAYHFLVGNREALPAMIYAMVVGAGFGEETLFRGYMFERLGRLFGTGGGGKAAVVIVTAALFGAAHYPEQGLAGAEQGAIVGLVFGIVYAATGRIAMLMIAHASFDLTALAIIYWDLETVVARSVFR